MPPFRFSQQIPHLHADATLEIAAGAKAANLP
jgi:hypothetical protein